MKVNVKHLFLLFVSVALFAVLSGCGQEDTNSEAQGESNADTEGLPDEIKDRGKFIIGVKEDYPPIGYIDESDENVGFEIDLIKEIAKSAFGDEDAIEFVPVTASNRIPYLTSNKIDFIAATIGITEDRKKEVDFSEPYMTSGVTLLVHEDSNIEDVSELEDEQVITIKGSTGSIYLDEEYPDMEQIKMDTTSDAVRALQDDRGVAFFGDAILQLDIAKGNQDLKLVGDQEAASDMAMAFRKDDGELLEYINEELEELKEDDYYKELLDEWLPSASDLFDDVGEMIPRPD